MREPQQQSLHDPEATLVVSGEETTLVSPRFDDEETLVARPVVPLENGEHAPAQDPPGAPPAQDARSPHALRRSRMLALALVSVLVGGVLGGAGLYLYQRQSQDPAVSPAATTQPDAHADAAQAPTAPAAAEVQAPPPSDTQVPPTEPPATAAPDAEETAAPDAEVPPTAAPREPESVPATERREVPAEDDDRGKPKRGKKGSRDEEIERRPAPRRRDDDDNNVARDNAREARRVDSIFYRPRRATRRDRARRNTSDSPDRLRRIFEGGPQ